MHTSGALGIQHLAGFPGHNRVTSLDHDMKRAVLCLSISALLFAACKRRGPVPTDTGAPGSATKPAVSEGKANAPAAPPSPAEPPNPAATGKSEFERRLYGGNPQETLRMLNQLVEGGQMSNPTPLTSLEQLVSAGAIPRIPPAPAGLRYAIDPKTKVAVLTK